MNILALLHVTAAPLEIATKRQLHFCIFVITRMLESTCVSSKADFSFEIFALIVILVALVCRNMPELARRFAPRALISSEVFTDPFLVVHVDFTILS